MRTRKCSMSIKIIVINVFILICVFNGSCIFRDEVLSEFVEEAETFSIKIKVISPLFPLGLGTLFRYKVLYKKPDGNWEEVFVEEGDDRFEPNSDNILLISSSKAFIFITRKYAVTKDQGKTWETFDLDNLGDLGEPFCHINHVLIEKDGSGEMRLRCTGKEKQVFTRDFGRSWKTRKGFFDSYQDPHDN